MAPSASRACCAIIGWSKGTTSPRSLSRAPDDERVYHLDDRVTLRGIDALNRSRRLSSRVGINLRRLVRLRAALKAFKADAIVAFTTEANLVAIWSALGLGVPVVVSERNQPDRPGLGRLTRAVRRLSYPLAAALVVQTEGIAQGVRARFGAPVYVLPNPIRLAAWRGEPRAEQATNESSPSGASYRKRASPRLSQALQRWLTTIGTGSW